MLDPSERLASESQSVQNFVVPASSFLFLSARLPLQTGGSQSAAAFQLLLALTFVCLACFKVASKYLAAPELYLSMNCGDAWSSGEDARTMTAWIVAALTGKPSIPSKLEDNSLPDS